MKETGDRDRGLETWVPGADCGGGVLECGNANERDKEKHAWKGSSECEAKVETRRDVKWWNETSGSGGLSVRRRRRCQKQYRTHKKGRSNAP